MVLISMGGILLQVAISHSSAHCIGNLDQQLNLWAAMIHNTKMFAVAWTYPGHQISNWLFQKNKTSDIDTELCEIGSLWSSFDAANI